MSIHVGPCYRSSLGQHLEDVESIVMVANEHARSRRSGGEHAPAEKRIHRVGGVGRIVNLRQTLGGIQRLPKGNRVDEEIRVDRENVHLEMLPRGDATVNGGRGGRNCARGVDWCTIVSTLDLAHGR
jgi:hypothetical protein